MPQELSDIQQEFRTASNFPLPAGTQPRWTYHYHYPQQLPPDRPTWLNIKHKENPELFVNTVKKYILDGNLTDDGHLYVNDKWYHAAWLHYGDHGREPISGHKYAGAIDPGYISESQNRYIQVWLNSYFNGHAAHTLYKFWGDGSKPPVLDPNGVDFRPGSLIFETVFTDATEREIYTLKEVPTLPASIIDQPPLPNQEPDAKKRGYGAKKLKVDTLRLIQTDFAARIDDDPNDPNAIGWVFGTFIHDGTPAEKKAKWDHLVPVGIEWGNDPSLTQDKYDAGKRSNGCWLNTRALDIINSFKGYRPWLGWHGRLNGPVDNFMSTCTSCHATAQIDTRPKGEREGVPWTQPTPVKIPEDGQPGIWVDHNPKKVTKWFEDHKTGERWDENHVSAGYNRHVQFPYENYRDWAESAK